jgi:hypothetical protein
MRTSEPTLPTSRQNLPPAEIDCKWWKQGYCFRDRTCYFRHDPALAGVDNPKYEANREKKEQREGETGDSTWTIVSIILMKAHMMMYSKQTQYVRTTTQRRHPEVLVRTMQPRRLYPFRSSVRYASKSPVPLGCWSTAITFFV